MAPRRHKISSSFGGSTDLAIPRRNMLIFVGLQHLGMHLFCFVGLFGFFAGLKKGANSAELKIQVLDF